MPGGVAPKFGSEKVSRYTKVSQPQLRVSRYTVQLSSVHRVAHPGFYHSFFSARSSPNPRLCNFSARSPPHPCFQCNKALTCRNSIFSARSAPHPRICSVSCTELPKSSNSQHLQCNNALETRSLQHFQRKESPTSWNLQCFHCKEALFAPRS